jgi:glycosyltransferase involved in cell wall biosynthesis
VLLICYLGLGFLFIRLGVVLLNVLSDPRLRLQEQCEDARVSVLIPVRNEAHNLPELFRQLDKLGPEACEIIALDDQSSDGSTSLLETESKRNARFHYLKGTALPSGWLGKNWACQQLSQQATGDYLLFLDADIAYLHPQLLSSALAEMRRKQLSLLSLFPDQIMKSAGEWAVVPLMHYLLLSLLPLSWIYRIPLYAIAAANGQFMLFEAKSYHAHRWHEQVKNKIVEDIAIMRLLKQAELRGHCLTSGGMIRARMYSSYPEALSGFSKNILAGFGNSLSGMLAFLFFVLGYWPWAVGILPLWMLGLALLAILGIRIGVSRLAGQSAWKNVLLHPWQMANLLVISFVSIFKKLKRNNQWKGRNVQLN